MICTSYSLIISCFRILFSLRASNIVELSSCLQISIREDTCSNNVVSLMGISLTHPQLYELR